MEKKDIETKTKSDSELQKTKLESITKENKVEKNKEEQKKELVFIDVNYII